MHHRFHPLFQELLGLGLNLGPGMLTSGNMEREDDQPKFRQTLSLRPEESVTPINTIDVISEEGSEIMNESVISSVVDR